MIDILEHIQQVFGINVDTAATIIITLIVFITGQLLLYITNFIKRFFERRSIKKLFIKVLEAAIRTIRKQEESYIGVINNMTFENLPNLTQKRSEFYHLDLLKELSYPKIHSSFFSGLGNILRTKANLKSKAFVKSWEVMNGLDFWTQQGYDQINFYADKYNEHDKLRSNAMKGLRQYVDKMALAVDGKKVDKLTHEYLTAFYETDTEWKKTMDRRPHVVHRKLVLPMRILNRKYRNLSVTQDLNNYLLEATFQYECMSKALKKGRDQYNIYARNSRYFYRSLEKVIKILK